MNKLTRLTLIVAVLAIIGLAAHVTLLEGLGGLFWACAFHADSVTRYAPGYTDGAFRHVTLGMSKEEVMRLLGKPIRIQLAPPGTDLHEHWVYSESPTSSNYHARIVIFGTDGHVVERVAEFYVD